MSDYLKIGLALIQKGDEKEIASVFRLRDEATAAMVRQCSLADEPSDDEVSIWLSKFSCNAPFLGNSLKRTGQKIVKA